MFPGIHEAFLDDFVVVAVFHVDVLKQGGTTSVSDKGVGKGREINRIDVRIASLERNGARKGGRGYPERDPNTY